MARAWAILVVAGLEHELLGLLGVAVVHRALHLDGEAHRARGEDVVEGDAVVLAGGELVLVVGEAAQRALAVALEGLLDLAAAIERRLVRLDELRVAALGQLRVEVGVGERVLEVVEVRALAVDGVHRQGGHRVLDAPLEERDAAVAVVVVLVAMEALLHLLAEAGALRAGHRGVVGGDRPLALRGLHRLELGEERGVLELLVAAGLVGVSAPLGLAGVAARDVLGELQAGGEVALAVDVGVDDLLVLGRDVPALDLLDDVPVLVGVRPHLVDLGLRQLGEDLARLLRVLGAVVAQRRGRLLLVAVGAHVERRDRLLLVLAAERVIEPIEEAVLLGRDGAEGLADELDVLGALGEVDRREDRLLVGIALRQLADQLARDLLGLLLWRREGLRIVVGEGGELLLRLGAIVGEELIGGGAVVMILVAMRVDLGLQ